MVQAFGLDVGAMPANQSRSSFALTGREVMGAAGSGGAASLAPSTMVQAFGLVFAL